MKRLNEMWTQIGYGLGPRRKELPAPGHALGFRPALLDFATMRIYPAPLLPERGVAAKGTMVSGFERSGFFYTRQAVARACQEWPGAN